MVCKLAPARARTRRTTLQRRANSCTCSSPFTLLPTPIYWTHDTLHSWKLHRPVHAYLRTRVFVHQSPQFSASPCPAWIIFTTPLVHAYARSGTNVQTTTNLRTPTQERAGLRSTSATTCTATRSAPATQTTAAVTPHSAKRTPLGRQTSSRSVSLNSLSANSFLVPSRHYSLPWLGSLSAHQVIIHSNAYLIRVVYTRAVLKREPMPTPAHSHTHTR